MTPRPCYARARTDSRGFCMDDAPSTPPVTRLLADWQRGDIGARDRLFEFVHPELRRLAAAAARHERPNHSLDAPALVNELYLR